MPKFKKSLGEIKLNLPIVNESTLVVPEFFAVKRTSKTGKESYRLVNPLTKSRNLSKRNGETTIKLIRRPVEHMIIMSHKTEPIPLTMFSKKDRNTITEHFKVVETHRGKPIQEVPDSAPFANKKRGPQAREKRKYTKYATQEERDEARKKADRDRKFKKRQQLKGGGVSSIDDEDELTDKVDELKRLYSEKRKLNKLENIANGDDDKYFHRMAFLDGRIEQLENQYMKFLGIGRRDFDALMGNALNVDYLERKKRGENPSIEPIDIVNMRNRTMRIDENGIPYAVRQYGSSIVNDELGDYDLWGESDSESESKSDNEDMSNKAGGAPAKGIGLAGHIMRHLHRGGALSAKHIKEFADASYKKESPLNIDDFVLDKDLTNDFAKTYYNNKTKQAVVVHRGTNPTIGDWLNNAHYVMGTYKLTRRYWTGKKIQDGAEKKYGAKNVSTLGHSQGAILTRDLGGKSKEIITINPAYLGEKQKENEFRIRSSADPVSGLLAPVNKLKEGINWLIGGKKKENYDKQNITIKADTLNPLTEHSYEILDRIHPDTIIGVPEIPQDIEGGSIKNHLVQSIIFHKNKFSISSAKKWLKENGYKCSKVDEESNTIRFRQISPITIKTQGYTEYHNKTLGDSGIILVIAYKHNKGGDLHIHKHIIHIHH